MAPKRILIVDDEPLILYALTRTLARDGVEVIAVGTAEEALVKVATQPFDLCLLDHLLPGMTGIDAMPMLREKAPAMQIVVVTASYLTAEERGAIDAMATRLIEKPFDINRVKEFVDFLLQRSPAHQ